MANIIRLKRSATASAVPLSGSLVAGELAVNTADGKLYLKKDDASVVQIGASTGMTQSVNVQTFSASGTWTKPTGAQTVLIEMIGGGEGGQGGSTGNTGRGGTAGTHIRMVVLASELGGTEIITIGAGGSAGAPNFGLSTGAGDTTIGSNPIFRAGGATTAQYIKTSLGNVLGSVFGSCGANGAMGFVGGMGSGGGGSGAPSSASPNGGAGGAARSLNFAAFGAAQGGGGAGGTGPTGTSGTAGSIHASGFGGGGGGGGYNSGGAGGNGGAGVRGGGGGAGARGTTAGGSGGLGGQGYAVLTTICYT